MEEKSKSIYNKYVIYQMKEFSPDTPDPIHCPKCGGKFTKSIQPHSHYAKDLLENPDYPFHPWLECGRTYLMVCDQCQWWYIREALSYVSDITEGEDYIIYGIADPEPQLKTGCTTPWEQALADDHLYNIESHKKIPEDIHNMFLVARQENLKPRLAYM
jgi:hypothetical protein